MDYHQILRYIRDFNVTADKSEPAYFALTAFTIVLLEKATSLPLNVITVLDTVNGNKVGWPLGAILHEINNFWELRTLSIGPHGAYVLRAL